MIARAGIWAAIFDFGLVQNMTLAIRESPRNRQTSHIQLTLPRHHSCLIVRTCLRTSTFPSIKWRFCGLTYIALISGASRVAVYAPSLVATQEVPIFH